MRRRDFIAALGGVAALPAAARAQQQTISLIGFLSSLTQFESSHLVAAFRRGLSENGFVEGQNVSIDYRWADGRYDRLPGLARELVGRGVAAFVSVGGHPTLHAAKAATS